jgi:hypothetical protein
MTNPQPMSTSSAGLLALALALAGCNQPQNKSPADYGVLRTRLFQDCMDRAAKITPSRIADRGSWSEVVSQCGDQAYYQANACDDPKACLAQLYPPRASQEQQQ